MPIMCNALHDMTRAVTLCHAFVPLLSRSESEPDDVFHLAFPTKTICYALYDKPRCHVLSRFCHAAVTLCRAVPRYEQHIQNQKCSIKTQTFKTNNNIKTQTATSAHNKQHQHPKHKVWGQKAKSNPKQQK